MLKIKFNYRWVIVAICFIAVCTSLGLCSSNRTMYLTAITEALNFKRSAFALNDTFRYVATAVMNLFFGFFVNKLGTKWLMSAGFVCLIGFALINSVAESLVLFYLAGILLGIGLSWTGTAMMSTVINRWCDKNRGMITGAILAANGLGGAVSVQIISPIIFEEGNLFGYRNSYKLVALILTVVLLIVLFFFKENPKGEGRTNVEVKKKRKVRGAGWVGMEYTEAVKKPYFYLSLVCMALIGMSLQGLGGIATPHMYDLGIDKQFVANIMTVSSFLLIFAKFFIGILYDKSGLKITMNICLLSSFLSIGGLVLVSNTPFGKVIAFIRLLFSTTALPLETVMLPFFAAELFGNKCFDKTIGLYTATSCVGFALGAPFANLCYDLFGNYNPAFIFFALLMLFTTVAMQFVVRAAAKDKEKILRALEATEPSDEALTM